LKNWCICVERGYLNEDNQNGMINSNNFYEEVQEFEKRKEDLRDFMLRSYVRTIIFI
jgi:hypothetical protein